MFKIILNASLVLLLSSCGPLITPTPTDSGITGQVLIGPMCPVMVEGQDCPDRPYQATITVTNLEGRQVVRFQTDEQGQFKVPLAPGEYILHPETPEGKPLPRAGEQNFTVHPGQYTRLDISYDSGIR